MDGADARARWRELAIRLQADSPIPADLREWAARTIFAMLGDPDMGGQVPGPEATADQRAEAIIGGSRTLTAAEIVAVAGLTPPAHRPRRPELWLRDRLLAAEVAALVEQTGCSIADAEGKTAARNAVSPETVKRARSGK